MSIWLGWLGTAECPPHCAWASPNHWGPEQHKKKEERKGWWLLSWAISLLPSDRNSHHWLPWISGLWTWTGTIPPAFLGLQPAEADCGTSQPPWSHKPISYLSLSFIFIYIAYCFCCPGEPWLIQSYVSFRGVVGIKARLKWVDGK